VDGAEPVHVVHLARLVEWKLRERPVVGDAGVGHEHVDVAELRDRTRDGIGVGHVARERRMPVARELRGEPLERLPPAGRQADRGAAPRERSGDRLADPARGARHQHAGPGADLHGGHFSHHG
jgi:hypothetical protein